MSDADLLRKSSRSSTAALLAAIVALAVALLNLHYRATTDHAVYELETGEYLHCTPQGGNDLACEVTHRKDNQ